jgi:hypothetical protein
MAAVATTDPGNGERCSVLARRAAEPALGTAPPAAVWVGVEQPGPWGPRPLQHGGDSHLPEPLRQVLAEVDGRAGVKVLLLRRPGRHADTPPEPHDRQVLLSCVRPGRRFLVSTTARSVADLLALDLPACADSARSGIPPAWGRSVTDPVTLVCTNGRRDRCCAIAGRAVADELSRLRPGAVWECTHLGGHRFAPTALVLPAGAAYAGLGASQLHRSVAGLGAGRLALDGLRGLTALSPEQQVADATVRSVLGVDDLEATRPRDPDAAVEAGTRVVVSTPQGDWVTVVSRVLQPERAESCGKPAVPRTDLVADPPVAT